MEQQRETYNLMIIFLLAIASIHDVSSNQNLYTTSVTTTVNIDGDKVTDHSWLQPLNTTTSIYQDFTTYLPTSTSIQAEEILDSSETNALSRFARPFYHHNEHKEDDEESVEEPPDHAIPYSEHEEARDVPTQPKYVAPGVWAKPPPDKDLDFVPTKLHAQVRGSHTVKRLPQREAIESAETDEEKRNAPRLRAVVTNSKVNTVYTEEGYEDSGYDHAGHIRDADFHEGFARKLHDQKKKEQHFPSGNENKGENENLVPDEFKEYEEDYEDHLQENKKFEEADDEDNLIGHDKNSWEESEIDPKFVAENNIQKLEEDIEKEAEEAERSEKIYQNAQESKLRNDIKVDSSESEESHVEDNSKHENKSIKKKKKKSKLRNGKSDNVSKKTKKSRKLERKKKLKNPKDCETTVLPLEQADSIDVEASSSPRGFAKNSPQRYSIDQTTLSYVAPFDEPTTPSYSQLFWDYFKARQGPSITESSALVSSPTTMNPIQEARTPIAVATIDSHGPYLLVTKEETVTSPPAFLGPRSFRPRNLFSDDVEFGPTSAKTHSRYLLGQSDGVSYVNNLIATPTVVTFTSVPSLSPGGVEYSSSTAASSNTPLNFTQEAYARMANYFDNPFLGSVLDNSNVAASRNKQLKYKVLARAKPSLEKKSQKPELETKSEKEIVKPVTQSPPQEVSPSFYEAENENKKIRDELSAKYNKMLNYIKSKQEAQSFPKEKKIFSAKDPTPRKPIQRVAYSIVLTNHPSMNRSGVSAESESSRERAGPKSEANWKSKSQLHHHSQPAKSPFRFDPFAHVQPIYNKNSLPTTKLLPPPLPLASTYANYRSNKQNEHSYLGGKPQQQRDNSFKYFPLNLEASWRARSRRKRSEGEFRDDGSNATDVDVKAAANNSVTNDNKSEQQDKSSFDRVIDRLEGKSSSRRVIDAPIDVPDALKLVLPARSRGDESGTKFRNKSGTAANGERKNAEDGEEIVIGTSKIGKKGSILIQSAKETRRINTDVELAKKKRDVKSERHLIKNLRNKVNEKNHEELLNDSPKISGDVIDEEIDARFNEEDNETPSKIKKHGKVEAEVPSFDYVEELLEDDEKSLVKSSATTETAIDLKKYPFYNNEDVPSASALKYVVDPRIIPRKTVRGMEFYDSRNAYKQCDEVEPNLDKVLPEKEEPDPERGLQEDLPRLRGLGDKLDCFKAKYFDENPLDNPLFAEKFVEEPTPPTEINPTKFASKIMVLPEENDEYVVPQVSKKPERSSRQNWRNRNRPYEALESIRVNYKHDPQTGRGRNAYLHTVRGSRLTRNMMRRVKNRKSWPKITTTPPSPKLYQTDSYQSQVYEDVMGNIRNMKNTYQVYEMTTMPPSTQILVTAGSENTLKVADDTSEEKSTLKPDVTDVIDVTNKTKLSEIKGLIPPPKYVIYRQNYRKHRPLAKSRVSFIRSPTLPRIIAHHHTIKIKKRSTADYTAKNSSETTMNENKTAAINGSMEVDAIGNDTLTVKLAEEKAANKRNVTSEPLDLEIEESRPIAIKINDTKKRRNSTSSDLKSEPQKVVYTIRDRIRYSKPKWDTWRRFGKFTTSSKTADEDSRRKEPRYNRIERKRKPADDQQNNSIIMNSTENTLGIESAKSFIEDRESSTIEAYHAQESAVQQKILHKKNEFPEVEKAEDVDAEFEESFFKKDEEESTTNTYQVRENVNENVSTTTTRSTNPQSSREVLDLEKFLESDPPGYAETFFDEATTPSSKYRSDMNHESEDSDEKAEEETDYPRNVANPWDNDSSEKTEEQVETPVTTKLFSEDDDSEEPSSKEEEESDKDQTFFTYPKKMSLIESDKDDENSEKVTSYKAFPFSRYKSNLKKESEENDPEEESEEKREDYVFPWHADKKSKKIKYKWLYNLDRYEYPWERRDRLEKERKRRKQGKFFDEDEEESIRYDVPVYPWEKYNVPTKNYRMNTRRDLSRRYADDSKESTTEFVPFTKYSSRYSSNGTKPSKFSSAREISRSIKKFLDGDEPKGASKEVESSPSFVRKSSSSDRGISRGMLVPEDITQPPRRRNARRKVNRNMANSSRFNSKNLRSEDVTDEEKEEEPGEYVSKSDLDNPELSTEITSSQPSQSEIPSATEQRKKRRRKILKNNFTTSHDNASAESFTKPTKKRRRKLHASTTTTATPTTSIDFDSIESAFTPIKKKYSKKDEKTNRSDFSERAAAKISKADDFPIVTSTPKTRTIEHRSRVSKEKIVTKTTYPNDTENFNFTNPTPNRKVPVKRMRRRKNNNKRDGSNEDSDNKKELIKQEAKEGNYEIKFNEDAIKKSMIDKSQDKSRNKGFKHFGIYDEIFNNENNNDNSNFGTPSEVSLSPQHRTVQLAEHDTRYLMSSMSSMSWMSNNYDY